MDDRANSGLRAEKAEILAALNVIAKDGKKEQMPAAAKAERK